MHNSRLLAVPLLVLPVALAACGGGYSAGSSGSASHPSSSAHSAGAIVRTAQNQQLGSTILVNSSGLTLYRLSGEGSGKFICTGACLQNWHPLLVATGKPKGAVGSLGEIKRPEGTEQVTFKGMPLYTFAADHAAGQAHGQGFKDVGTWNAVTASGAGATAPAKASSSGSGSSSSGGYGY